MTIRPRLALLWVVAGALAVYRLRFWSRQPPVDLQPHWDNLRALLSHRQLYTESHQVFPPSFLLPAAPLGLLPLPAAMAVVVLLNAAAILSALAITLGLLGVDWRSAAGAWTLLAFSFLGGVSAELGLGNVNGVVLLCEVGFVVATCRGRWLVTGALLGASLAVKPTLLPLALLFLIWRRWPALLVAAAVPAALLVPGLALGVGADRFFRFQLPFLLHGQPDIPHFLNISLTGAGESLRLPSALVTGLRLILAGVGLGVLWRQRSRPPAAPSRMLDLVSFVLLLGLVESAFLWEAYSIFLTPLMVSLARSDSIMRRWPALMGAALISFPTTLLERVPIPIGLPLRWQVYTFGYLLLLGALAVHIHSAPPEAPPARPQDQTGGAGLDTEYLALGTSQTRCLAVRSNDHQAGGWRRWMAWTDSTRSRIRIPSRWSSSC